MTYKMIDRRTDEIIGEAENRDGYVVGDEIWQPSGVYKVVDVIEDKLFVVRTR